MRKAAGCNSCNPDRPDAPWTSWAGAASLRAMLTLSEIRPATKADTLQMSELLNEIIRIGREAQVPVHVSHLKVAGFKNWHLWETVVEVLENARKDGIEITCDVYPYFHSSTTLLAVLPPWQPWISFSRML